MATHEAVHVPGEDLWSGGGSPYAVGSKKLGMWLFIVSDAITFSALLIAYSFLRVGSLDWPRPFEGPSIANATVMTAVLLSSSITMVMAVRAAKMGNRGGVVGWVLATALGGVTFDVLHIREWLNLIVNEHVSLFHNPWGTPMFGASFFTLTGLHMTHVTIGVIYLCVIAWGTRRGKYSAEDVEVSGLYWHFVDLVWMFIFPLVYLMSAKFA
ncbi:MAG TPA: cytochrome c oxidase subunit 3 [Terriglobia bacterium]|nr:cytochrome c oxidase subunit 3 [Terriglobia bacterium]